jgi:hypothetical protein
MKLKTIRNFFIILFILFSIVLLPSVLPVQSSQQKQSNINENMKRSMGASAFGIFENNFVIAVISFVPVVGWGIIGGIMWKTGLVIASYTNPGIIWVFFAFIELSVYSFVLLQSLKIVKFFYQRKQGHFWVLTGKTTALTFAVSALVLLLSAIVEYAVILRTVFI